MTKTILVNLSNTFLHFSQAPDTAPVLNLCLINAKRYQRETRLARFLSTFGVAQRKTMFWQ